MGLKLAVVGGGSTYTPELIEGIARRAQRLPVDELLCLAGAAREGFLNEEVLAVFERCFGHREVKQGGCDDRDGINLRGRKDIVRDSGDFEGRVQTPDADLGIRVDVRHGDDGTPFGVHEVANNVGTPVTVTYYSDFKHAVFSHSV